MYQGTVGLHEDIFSPELDVNFETLRRQLHGGPWWNSIFSVNLCEKEEYNSISVGIAIARLDVFPPENHINLPIAYTTFWHHSQSEVTTYSEKM